MPDEGKEDSVATAALRNRRDRPWPLIGLGLLAVAGAILLSRVTLWPDGDAWFLFLIAGGRDPLDHAASDGRRADGRIRARAEAHAPRATGLRLARDRRGIPRRDPGDRRRDLRRGVRRAPRPRGRRQDVRRHERGALQDEYRLGIGTLELDLSGMHFPPGVTHVETSVDVGDLQVIAPAGRRAPRLRRGAERDTSICSASEDDGWNADVDLGGSGARVLVLEAHVGAGSVRVERALR